MRRLTQNWRVVILWLIAMFILGIITANLAGGYFSNGAVCLASLMPAIGGLLTFVIPIFLRGAGSQPVARDEGKAKRGLSNRIERLVEDLDEDEIVELETLLLARGSEALDAHKGSR